MKFMALFVTVEIPEAFAVSGHYNFVNHSYWERLLTVIDSDLSFALVKFSLQ